MAAAGVSIVIPTYNRARLVGRAIGSALPQMLPHDELIVVDDGSTDETPQVIAAGFRDVGANVRYLRVDNGGAGRARNIGMREARHELVAFLDSDDEWLPGGLAVRRAVMQAMPQAVFCMTDFDLLEPQGRVPGGLAGWTGDVRAWDDIIGAGRPFSTLGPLPAQTPDFHVHVGSLYRVMLGIRRVVSYVSVNTALVRRTRAAREIWFPEDVPTYEDWEFFSRLSRAGPCAYADLPTALQRTHDGPRLTGLPMLVRTQARLRIIERVWASDPAYMREHGGEVDEVMRVCRRRIARELIRMNRRGEAREWLRPADATWKERVLMHVPHPVLRLLGRAG